MAKRWRIAAVAWTIAVLAMTLSPGDTTSSRADLTPWYCLVCGPAGGADVLQNLLLLLPLGAFVAIGGAGFRNTAALVTSLPLMIELLQATVISGRDATLSDVLANSAGGMIGWLIGRNRELLTRPAPRVAAPIAAGSFALQLLATTLLTEPMPTGPEPWRWSINPVTASRPVYRGAIEMIAFRGDTMIVSPGRSASVQLPDNPSSPASAEFAVRATWSADSTTTLTPILRLDDADDEAIVALDRRGNRLGISIRTHAASVGLRQPTVVIPLPTGLREGDRIAVSASTGDDGLIRATVDAAAGRTAVSAPFGAQHGWTLINPFTPVHDLGASWQWWTVAWLYGWGAILGWSLLRGSMAERAGWCAAGLVILLLMSLRSHTGTTPLEMIGYGAGALSVFSAASLRRSPDAASAATGRHSPGTPPRGP